MTEPRLTSKLLIHAGVRLCLERGIPVTIVKMGDPDAGSIYIKLNGFENGCSVLNQERVENGKLVWLKATGNNTLTEIDADAYIDRQAKYDPDIWVLEVEDRQHRNPFDIWE